MLQSSDLGIFDVGKRLRGLAAAAALGLTVLVAAPAFAETATPTPAPAAVETVAAPAETPAPTEAVAAPEAAAEAEPAAIEAPVATVDKGDTTWLLVATMAVLIMTIPGLAVFYGGLVRTKNMLSKLMQVTTCALIGMIAWAYWGYSLSFTDGGALDSFIGGTGRLFLNGLTPASNAATFSTGVYIPEIVFFAFQMTFAAITASIVLGGTAERMKFTGVVMFSILWPLLSYYPIAHMVWWWPGPDAIATNPEAPIRAGYIWAQGGIDFAGGTVVHINAGIAALVGALFIGKRIGYLQEPMPPHSLTLTYIGAGLLWFGWFGFNAGSNLEANGYAGLALVNTFLCTASAGLSWIVVEWITRGKPSMLGLASGMVAGLVAVTPAAGFAGPMGAIVMGLIVSPLCVLFVSGVKNIFKYDESLDAFGIHGVGGVFGAIATGFVVNPAWGGAGVVDYTTCAADGDISTCDTAAYDMVAQVTSQLKAAGIAVVWSLVASIIVFGLIKLLGQLRVKKEVEEEGLDISEHGERAYHH